LLAASDDPRSASVETQAASLARLDAAIQRLEASRPNKRLALTGLVLGSVVSGGGLATLLSLVVLADVALFGGLAGSSISILPALFQILPIVGGVLLLVGLPFVIAGAIGMRRASVRNDEIDAEMDALKGQRQDLERQPGATVPELPVIPVSFAVTVAQF
jgi:hypothetical protein